jgi:hypothetical protein
MTKDKMVILEQPGRMNGFCHKTLGRWAIVVLER